MIVTNFRFCAFTLSTALEKTSVFVKTLKGVLVNLRFCKPPFLCAFARSSANGFKKMKD